MRGRESVGWQGQWKRQHQAAGGHNVTVLSHWVINHVCVTAEFWSTRHHHWTAAWDGEQVPTK